MAFAMQRVNVARGIGRSVSRRQAVRVAATSR
jgi:hypothetical protein